MPINRYEIRNVYCLADPQLYKLASGKDDPEALLDGVAMAGLVGVLRQLGDLAEFSAEIFRDLHEEVMSTAARGHGLLVRIKHLESEIPPIERAFLSRTSHSAFFLNSGVDWHPSGRTTQNLITTGDLPRFVMDSYEECRGPPRLFLLDKFDVGGAGACLKRYTDPSVFKVEASIDETEITETIREKKIRQTKKKASRWKGGETPEVSQSSHAKLHQLFLEERTQTGATEAAGHMKLKKMPKKSPFGSEHYMNKLLDSPSRAEEVAHAPSKSRFEDSSTMGSPMKNTSPCVSSSKVAESHPSYADLEVHDNQITVNGETHTNGLQNAYPSESEVETRNQGTNSDANKHQLSDSQSIENLTATHDENNSITKVITASGNPETENAPPVGADSPSKPFAFIEIPFNQGTPTGADITNDTCIDVSKVPNVDQVANLEDDTLDTDEMCSDTGKLDSPRKSDERQFDKEDLDNKYPNDNSTPMILVTNILETTKNQTGYDFESHSTHSVVSSSQSVISRVNELSSDTVFNDDISVTEEQLEEKGADLLVISDQAEGETESDNLGIEPVAVADANTNECIEDSVPKDETGTRSEVKETESKYSDGKRDDDAKLNPDSKESVDDNKFDQSSSESHSVLVSEKPPTMELRSHDIITDHEDIIAPCHHESTVSTKSDHDLESLDHGDHVDVQPSFVEDKVNQPIGQLPTLVSEKLPTMELISHEIKPFDQVKQQPSPVLSGFTILPQLPQVKVEDPPPLPPLPPMQWRMRKLQNPWSTPINGGQHIDSHQEVTFDETHEENQKPHTQLNEVFWPSSSLYSLPRVLEEMQNDIRPMKIHRSPLIDAVAAHDKNKLRKVSDLEPTQILKGDEKDTLLDQILAKSVNLKPAVQTRPSIQGPTTNLRVVAILEKANAIRQAFAGSDDDDSDNWSDS
ncbi:uncharacterized protein LOC143557891 [Bidens hawaiensis]|uniref:uncharacterized protein LOC143557891 n=1 Tax=Bidens hawaiensis TaxID=980011 RepID=UPI0040493C73